MGVVSRAVGREAFFINQRFILREVTSPHQYCHLISGYNFFGCFKIVASLSYRHYL